ncbi:hypothetical protein P9202_1226 [Prochlorococcus marinus str. MIT 9202]|nr:hypothetical protein P9202_1226 [Prochlorococcus marinus str. MIT 9202]
MAIKKSFKKSEFLIFSSLISKKSRVKFYHSKKFYAEFATA